MRRSSTLRRVLFGGFFAGSMAFGTAQALGASRVENAAPVACNRYDPFAFEYCTQACQEAGYLYGVCASTGYCTCRNRPPAIPE